MKGHVTIVAIGATGTGKSQLCQYIFQDTSKFHPSRKSDSFTQVCEIQEVEFSKFVLRLIDTPGLESANDRDSQYIQEIVNKLKPHSVNLFILTLNGQHVRFDKRVEQTVEYFRDIFGPELLGNLCIVFTRAPPVMAKRMRQEEDEREWIQKVSELFSSEVIGNIPTFYVNSVDDGALIFDEAFNQEELQKLFVAARRNDPFYCGQAKVVKTETEKIEDMQEDFKAKLKLKENEVEEAKEKVRLFKLQHENELQQEKEKRREEKEKRKEEERKRRDAEERAEKARRDAESARTPQAMFFSASRSLGGGGGGPTTYSGIGRPRKTDYYPSGELNYGN